MPNADSTRGTRSSSTTVRAGSARSPNTAASAARMPMSVDPATRLMHAMAPASTSSSANRSVKAGEKSRPHSPINEEADKQGVRKNPDTLHGFHGHACQSVQHFPCALFGRPAPGKTCPMSDWIDAEGFRANVGIVLMRENGEVFLGQRTGGRGWQFPQGGVRQGEQVEQAVFRELQEEIGLTREHVVLAGSHDGLAALSTAEALRAPRPRTYLHRAETALVPAAARHSGSGPEVQTSRAPTSRNSMAGAGQTTGSRCARSSTSSARCTCAC